ncbi:MAG: heterodisulfide reductase-related iron-sulfur binding cluster, partial [Nitrospirota bacterium]
MKYAFFPGCVSKGACPELYQSVMQVYPKLGIDLAEMTTATCTGAGVLQEKDPRLGDALNARTFALAEQQGLPIMTICSTCQGVMSQAN